MVAGAVCLVVAGTGGVAVAHRSTHCPKMPGQVVAANSSLDVSRSQAAFGGFGGDGGDVYWACVRSGGSYSQLFLFAPPVGTRPTVKLAGGYVAIRGGQGDRHLVLLDPAWSMYASVGAVSGECQSPYDTYTACPDMAFAVDGFALDRLGRLAWVEEDTSRGSTWARLRVRTQAGTIRTVARRRGPDAITSVQIVGARVRWSAGGRVHTSSLARPRCQVDPATDEVVASSREALVAARSYSADESKVFRACLRSDGRWRQLYKTEGGSHGTTVSNALAAGTRVALSWLTYPEDNHGLLIVDLRTNRWDNRGGGYPGARIDALEPDGRYLYELSPSHDSTRLYAARPGAPDVQLDEGTGYFFTSFTDVKIDRGGASWKNAGVAKSAPLP